MPTYDQLSDEGYSVHLKASSLECSHKVNPRCSLMHSLFRCTYPSIVVDTSRLLSIVVHAVFDRQRKHPNQQLKADRTNSRLAGNSPRSKDCFDDVLVDFGFELH